MSLCACPISESLPRDAPRRRDVLSSCCPVPTPSSPPRGPLTSGSLPPPFPSLCGGMFGVWQRSRPSHLPVVQDPVSPLCILLYVLLSLMMWMIGLHSSSLNCSCPSPTSPLLSWLPSQSPAPLSHVAFPGPHHTLLQTPLMPLSKLDCHPALASGVSVESPWACICHPPLSCTCLTRLTLTGPLRSAPAARTSPTSPAWVR